MLKSESIHSNEILSRPQKPFLVGVGYPSATAPVVPSIAVLITGIAWSQLLFEGLYTHGISSQTPMFVEVGGITIADEWIECRQLSMRDVQTSLLRRRAISLVPDAK